MKVLVAHERFPPDIAGGGEAVAFETARSLQARGLEVEVITTGDPASREVHGVRTRRIPVSRYRLNLERRAFVDAAADADVIHAFTYHALAPSLHAARVRRIPIVCGVLGLFGDEWRRMRGPIWGRLWQWWEARLIRRPFDRVSFLSDFSRDLALDIGMDPARGVVIAPGIDLAAFDRPLAKEDTVLFAGKFDSRKGMDDVVAVAKALPEIRFVAMGWGLAKSGYQAGAPPNLVFREATRGEEMFDQFARARIFFFPSRAETFGLVIAEAMAAGCAVVSTIPLGFEGALVGQHDRDAMVAAIRSMTEDPAATDAMGRKNKELAKYYDWARYAGDLHALYIQLVGHGTE